MRSPLTIACRRRSNSWRIVSTAVCGPVIAASAAACEIAAALVVDCPCSVSIALMSGAGPARYPMRQPVIA